MHSMRGAQDGPSITTKREYNPPPPAEVCEECKEAKLKGSMSIEYDAEPKDADLGEIGRCDSWCHGHPDPWFPDETTTSGKCKWDSNACSACEPCKEPPVVTKKHAYSQGEKGSECPLSGEIKTIEECREAIKSLGITPTVEEWIGDYNKVPRACSARASGNFGLHWNTAASGNGRDDLAPICRIPYHAGQPGTLCSSGSEVTSEWECREAIKSLGLPNKGEWIHDYTEIPRFCSLRKDGDRVLHFSKASTGKARGDLIPICKSAGAGGGGGGVKEHTVSFEFPGDIKALAKKAFDYIMEQAKKILKKIKEEFQKWIDDIKAKVTGWFDEAKNFGGNILNKAKEMFGDLKTVPGKLLDLLKKAKDVLLSPFKDFDKKIAAAVKHVVNFVGRTARAIADAAKKAFNAAKNAVVHAAKKAVDWGKQAVKDVGNFFSKFR